MSFFGFFLFIAGMLLLWAGLTDHKIGTVARGLAQGQMP